MTMKSIFRDGGTLPNTLAFVYVAAAYAGGWALLLRGSPLALVLGVPLLAHAMLVAAYLLHECAHGNLFRDRDTNARVGEVMSFLCGGAYAPFARIRHMHIRHHRDKGDFTTFDPRAFLRAMPTAAQRLVVALEWAYVPAVELLMHAQVIARPLLVPGRAGERRRVVAMLALRGGIALWLAWAAPLALLGYGVAYLLLLTGLNLGDAFHHTFEYHVVTWDEPVPTQAYDRRYEDEHTFSNLLSVRWPWLNLLTVNFGYHNAHHRRASVPWYALPALHRELYGERHDCVLPLGELLRSFHRHRVRRVLDEAYGDVTSGAGRADGFVGTHGVSFLSIV